MFHGVLLASGGLDSTVLAYKLTKEGHNILPLFIDYGQHCIDTEYEKLTKLIPNSMKHHIHSINLSDIFKYSSSRLIHSANLWEDKVTADDMYLPYRNLLFLSSAAVFAQSKGIEKVYAAFINSNHAKEIDCSYDFFSKLDNLLGEYGTVNIELPFRNYSKSDVARLGISLGVPIAETYSCQINPLTHCGACPNCVDRINALNSLIKEVENG